jgi:hypothetical protein
VNHSSVGSLAGSQVLLLLVIHILQSIFMDCPKGMARTNDECLELLKKIYGLVQSSRQYFKKFTGVLKKMAFQGGQVDPCLVMEMRSKGLIFIAIYVHLKGHLFG